jgi:hypothetical protein
MACCNDEASFERMKRQLSEELEAKLALVEPGQRKEWLTALRLEQEARLRRINPQPKTTAARRMLRRGR